MSPGLGLLPRLPPPAGVRREGLGACFDNAPCTIYRCYRAIPTLFRMPSRLVGIFSPSSAPPHVVRWQNQHSEGAWGGMRSVGTVFGTESLPSACFATGPN